MKNFKIMHKSTLLTQASAYAKLRLRVKILLRVQYTLTYWQIQKYLTLQPYLISIVALHDSVKKEKRKMSTLKKSVIVIIKLDVQKGLYTPTVSPFKAQVFKLLPSGVAQQS